MKKQKIAIYGAGGQGREVLQLIRQANAVQLRWECIGWFDDGLPRGGQVAGLPVLGGMADLNAWEEPLHLAIAIGWPAVKKKVLRKIQNEQLSFPILIHPSVALEPEEVAIGEGTIITQGCRFTVNIRIGRFVLLNLGCILTHDCVIGDYCGLMPSVNISGEVVVEDGAYLGTGVQVIQQRRIGADSIIGAGAVVTRDIPAGCTAAGVPARVVKFH
ncbi:MAG: acetyltransferase [Lewinellaceae bacterium]|nr:acetyltransferase [Phaeodactylibacter sp.]MCB9036106.1 acetyltransferase [Lewinellaceae bacterium]